MQVDGYEHFRSGACVLFEVADIQNWELDWNRQVERRCAARRTCWRKWRVHCSRRPVQLQACSGKANLAVGRPKLRQLDKDDLTVQGQRQCAQPVLARRGRARRGVPVLRAAEQQGAPQQPHALLGALARLTNGMAMLFNC